MDHIPSLDTYKDTPLLHEVLSRIDVELSQKDTSSLHPDIPKYTSSTSSSSTLLPKPFPNLSAKYTSSSPDLVLLTAHSQLRIQRNISLNRSIGNLNNLTLLHSIDLSNVNKSLDLQIAKKRKLLDDTKATRKKRLHDFKPINNFLNNRWNEKINQLIELSLHETDNKS